jgi:hypothetical protein
MFYTFLTPLTFHWNGRRVFRGRDVWDGCWKSVKKLDKPGYSFVIRKQASGMLKLKDFIL